MALPAFLKPIETFAQHTEVVGAPEDATGVRPCGQFHRPRRNRHGNRRRLVAGLLLRGGKKNRACGRVDERGQR
jgi:hypothetical protein